MKCLGYHIRKKQTKKIESGTFAMCKNHGTWQRNQSLPCAKVKAHGKVPLHVTFPRGHFFFCRGPSFSHGKAFAVCPIYGTRQRPALPTPGCRVGFAVCGTRQTLCRVHIGHGKAAVSRSAGGLSSMGAATVAKLGATRSCDGGAARCRQEHRRFLGEFLFITISVRIRKIV